jgi:hypothetical protein
MPELRPAGELRAGQNLSMAYRVIRFIGHENEAAVERRSEEYDGWASGGLKAFLINCQYFNMFTFIIQIGRQ